MHKACTTDGTQNQDDDTIIKSTSFRWSVSEFDKGDAEEECGNSFSQEYGKASLGMKKNMWAVLHHFSLIAFTYATRRLPCPTASSSTDRVQIVKAIQFVS